MSLWSWITNFGSCPHRRIRCVHGDEILQTMDFMGHVKRLCCIDCGAYLPGELPTNCCDGGW